MNYLFPEHYKYSLKSENENDCGKAKILVLSPTRELCIQIKNNVSKLCPPSVNCLALYGGESLWHQQQKCNHKIDIVVGTPGRIIDLVKKGSLYLHRIQYFVVDEADKMFGLGFSEQVKSISQYIRPDRQSNFTFIVNIWLLFMSAFV